MDDLTNYRLDEANKRAEKAEARFDQIDHTLTDIRGALSDIRTQLASTATRNTVWGALATSSGVGLGLLGVIVAILTYLQAFPHPH